MQHKLIYGYKEAFQCFLGDGWREAGGRNYEEAQGFFWV